MEVCVEVYVVYAGGDIRGGIRGIRRWRYTWKYTGRYTPVEVYVVYACAETTI